MIRRRRLRRRIASQNQAQYVIEKLQDYVQTTPSYLSDAEAVLASLYERAPYLNREATRELMDRLDKAINDFRGAQNAVAALTMFVNRIRAREDEYYE